MAQAPPTKKGTEEVMQRVEREITPPVSIKRGRLPSSPLEFADSEMTDVKPGEGRRARSRRKRKHNQEKEGGRAADAIDEFASRTVDGEGSACVEAARLQWNIEKEKAAIKVLIKRAYGCDQDPGSKVTVFHPSRGEFDNFDRLMAQVIKASSFKIGGVSHVGVSDVRLPTSWIATAHKIDLATLTSDTRRIAYKTQSCKPVPGSEDSVFTVHDEASAGLVTVAQWEVEASVDTKGIHGCLKDRCIRCSLRSEGYKAVYMTVQNETKTPELANVNSIGLGQPPVSKLHPLFENVPGARITMGGPGYISTLQYQRPGGLSLNYLASGHRRRWIIVNPNSKVKLESKLRRIYPDPPKNMSFESFIERERIYILPEFLRRHGIAFIDAFQQAGGMLVLFPGAYYASYSKDKTSSVSTTYNIDKASPSEQTVPRSLKRSAAAMISGAGAGDSGTQPSQVKRPKSTRVSPVIRPENRTAAAAPKESPTVDPNHETTATVLAAMDGLVLEDKVPP
ncbi:MAG: hypothetical protein M1839_002557 [Geoglossum umbratile]|nr:MAG: hypothetical protein M1839_002557 [Geoglossum umbratile]